MFKYRGFGLSILSQIPFPELLSAEFEKEDVVIETGIVPESLTGTGISKRVFSSATSEEYLLNIKKVAKYYAGYGKKVIIEPVPGIDEGSIRLFLLGTIMAAILYQRGSIPLHSSAVVKDGKVIVFPGHSGAGKSTMLAYLASKGYSIFTDDICVMQRSKTGGGIYCTASYPMIKLWENTINDLDSERFTKDFKLRPHLPKFGQFFYDEFLTDTLELGKIVILTTTPAASKEVVTRLTGLKAFKHLTAHAYRSYLMLDKTVRDVHFSMLTDIANNIPVYELQRPAGRTKVEHAFEAIKQILDEI